MAKPDIQISEVEALSSLDLVAKLRDIGDTKLKNEGSIRVGSKTYKVTYVRDKDGIDKLQMKRHYTGFIIGRFLNWCKESKLTTQSTALALNAKIADLMKTKDYQIARNTYDKLMEIAQTHKGDANGVIEVANYGHTEPRNRITTLGVVEAVNQKLKSTKSGKSIHLNKIDTYNTILGITNGTLMPHSYGNLMKKIAEGRLETNEELLDSDMNTVERKDLEKWRTFISDKLDKIDIPRKLFTYLNQSADASEDDVGLVGWKKDFKMNPDQALRHFVIKNMPASAMKAGFGNDESIDLMCRKIKEYIAIYNMEDGDEKKAKMAEFLNPENWPRTNKDKAALEKQIDEVIKNVTEKMNRPPAEVKKNFGKKIRAEFLKKNPMAPMESIAAYRLFANVLMYATFRQTSKLGLDFFKSQNTPILFHTSHRDLTDFGDTAWIQMENHWKVDEGHFDQTYGGSEITHSEVRHANKLIARYGGGTNGADLWFVKGAQ